MGGLYCCEPKLGEGSDGYHLLACSTQTEVWLISYTTYTTYHCLNIVVIKKKIIGVPTHGDLVLFKNILYYLSYFLKFSSFVATWEVTEHLCAAS